MIENRVQRKRWDGFLKITFPPRKRARVENVREKNAARYVAPISSALLSSRDRIPPPGNAYDIEAAAGVQEPVLETGQRQELV